ncbi:haloacid dehalogenase-like hydrolase family member protein [Theileria equi strain WA]|uniref:Haloacid dehalogenase-like hydrolase family member protein n=1 Tax=Theileria equi strain WA TaxID=1537102 RepID=L1LE24_THEEQ|nr:haloacid dehalogenase-like hydrolase family member protein [Theileria equi strain WA]EKX73534.1 haloacid dehalogenase-like hydrolase family member protein [Theileria equi strain WA]|eukprot:XP_004832986.1 haloacid dehalogenase-like hydrolase family member protein [Theileria equi strain WA]
MREYELVELDLSSRDAHITTTDWYSVSLTIFFSKSGQKIVKITQNKDTVWKSNMDDEHAHSLFLFKGKRSTMTLELEETATSEDSLEKTGVPRRMGGKNSEDKEGGISECQLLEIVVTKSPTNVRGEPTAPVGERIPSKFHRVYFYNEGGEWTPTDAATFNLKLDGMKMNGKITASDSTIAPNIAHFVKPESPPKYFGIDVDGTFFVENEAVFRKNIEAFAKVMKMGYTPFLCTEKKCDDKDSPCKCSDTIPGLKAEKRASQPTAGFTKYIHYLQSGGIFTLNKELSNGGKLSGGYQIESAGNNIPNVQSVSTYYWNGDNNTPILIEVITNGGNTTTIRYGRNNSTDKDWNPVEAGLNEQEALDQQNCKINNAIPLNITSPQSGDLPNDSKADCLKTRTINSAQSSPPPKTPPGSDYTVTGYTINGLVDRDIETKISRVTLRGNPVTFSTPPDAITEVRLYSSSVNTNAPIMVSFLKQGGESKWYESQNKEGTQWGEVGDEKTKKFYTKKNSTTPLPALSEKIDQVLCSKYKNVTLNLTKSNSENHLNGQNYCCEEHAGEKGAKGTGRVTVKETQIKDPSSSNPVKVYKHEINNGYSLAGIYYINDEGERKKIKIDGLQATGNDSVKVYALYSGDSTDPKLIYLHKNEDNNETSGWYQMQDNGDHDSNWSKIPTALKNITEIDLDRGSLECDKLKALKRVLKHDIGGLTDCDEPPEYKLQELLGQEPELKEKLERKDHEEDAKLKSDTGTATAGDDSDSTDEAGAEGGFEGKLLEVIGPLINLGLAENDAEQLLYKVLSLVTTVDDETLEDKKGPGDTPSAGKDGQPGDIIGPDSNIASPSTPPDGVTDGRTLNGSVSKLGASLFDRTDYKGYPGVYGNGTLVFDKEGNVIHQTYFSPSFISKIIQHINNTGYRQKVVFQDIERYYSLEFAPFIVSRLLLFYEKMNPLIVDEETLLKLKICSISILDCTFDIEDLKTEYSKKEVQLGMFCELVPRNATKATGIKKLMEHYGVPLEECGFIGDGDNDTEAMNFCKVSFAVGNSPDFVKRHAKWVMEKTCDEGAVAQALELVYK